MNIESIEDNIKKAEELEAAEEFFSASHFYQNAVKLLLKNGDKERIRFYKNKVVEMNKKMLVSGKDFKDISVEHEFTKEQTELLNGFIDNAVKGKKTSEALKYIGISHSFLPFVSNVRDMALKNMPISYSFASLSSISDQGHILRGGSDPQYHWFMKMYEITQQTIMQLYLLPIIQKIMSSESVEKLDYESLFAYFSQSGLIKEDDLNMLSPGLKSFFNKDYISCLHVLIPRFESMFLNLSEMCGIDIVSLDQKLGLATATKTLSDRYMSSKEFTDIWGEDFCQQVRFILFDPLGYKLRHKVAHGEISVDECNFQNAILIIYLFLVLLGRIEKKTIWIKK